MTCILTTPNGEVTLAGTGRAGTNGLTISVGDGAAQVVPMLRAAEPKVLDRGNRLVEVAFSSMATYASHAEAEAVMLALPEVLADQTNARAELGELVLYHVLASVQAKQMGASVAYAVSLRGRRTEQA